MGQDSFRIVVEGDGAEGVADALAREVADIFSVDDVPIHIRNQAGGEGKPEKGFLEWASFVLSVVSVIPTVIDLTNRAKLVGRFRKLIGLAEKTQREVKDITILIEFNDGKRTVLSGSDASLLLETARKSLEQ